ncbi:MAG: alpha/beta fold hydrolase [Alphaproteobacteria bacterium]|nr:alpha/beta fold hydrolase [Alphaproteobacteria bacterium]
MLLIMGLSVGLEGWSGQVEGLRAHHSLCVYDNRGVCRSDAPWGLYSTEALARDALGLMDHLGWERAHVVGLSLGGMIAQELALLAPERVRTLSLLSTHAGGWAHGRPTWAMASALTRRLMKKGRAERTRVSLRLNLSRRHIEALGEEAILEDLLRHPPAAQPVSGLLGQLHAALRHDARQRVQALSALPVLVMSGEHDQVVRPESGRALAEAVGAEWVMLEQTGHALIYEHPERVNAALRAHFERG